MKRFRFRLQKVLDLRAAVEKEKAGKLAEARRNAAEARRARDDLESVRNAGREVLTSSHGSGGSVGHLLNLEYVLEKMESYLAEADAACAAADEDVESTLKEYHEASQERRTLDQLREKRLEVWKKEANRQEQKAIDEVAITRFGRDQAAAMGE